MDVRHDLDTIVRGCNALRSAYVEQGRAQTGRGSMSHRNLVASETMLKDLLFRKRDIIEDLIRRELGLPDRPDKT